MDRRRRIVRKTAVRICCAAKVGLLSLTVATVLAADTSVDVNVADKTVGVGYGNLTENTNAFDLLVNLLPPENQTILSSKKHDDDGDIIWQGPEKSTLSDPPKREKHTWTGAGVKANLQHQVRFHGTFGGFGGSKGTPPEFDVGVVDLDIDVNCTGADTGDHSPPTETETEDKKEDEVSAGVLIEKGMIERLDPNSHALPSTIAPAQLATLPYKILRLNCQPRWHQSETRIGDVTFAGEALDSSFALYDTVSGKKVSSLPIPSSGLNQDLAIVTNDNFTAISDVTATYVWNYDKVKTGSGAEDIVRVTPVWIEITDVLDKDGNSVKSGSLDVKIGIDAPNRPAKIRYKIVGPPSGAQVTATQATIRIKYDDSNPAHTFFYRSQMSLGDNPVRILQDGSPRFIADAEYETDWDGRDDTPDRRLLLAGTFRLSADVTVQGTVASTKQPVPQEIAQPRAGHFCGDWPRASVFKINGSIPKEKINFGFATPPDTEAGDSIRPMRKNCFGETIDGGWVYMWVNFYYKEHYLGRWVAFTSAFNPKETKDKKINPDSEIAITISNIFNNTEGVTERYPDNGVRRGIMAKWRAGEGKWQIYWCDDPFDSGEWQPFKAASDMDVYLPQGGTVDLAFNGARDSSGNQIPDFKLASAAGAIPEDGAERVLFLLPRSDDQDHYNPAGASKGLVTVDLSGLPKTEGNKHSVQCFRGYDAGVRKFWGLTKAGIDCGVDARRDASAAAGYNSDFALNRTATSALDMWKNRVAFIDYDGHAAKGFLGWYCRLHPSEGEGDDFGELYDPSHHEYIVNSPTDESDCKVLPSDLDDVQFAILCACHNAEPGDDTPSTQHAMAQAGVDVVLAWNGTTDSNHALFAKLFLTLAHQKENLAYQPNWTDYPTVQQARGAAVSWLRELTDSTTADSVDINLVIDGARGESVAGATTAYPPRYGADDK